MGFESSHVARRRLAAAAMCNRRVHEALATITPSAHVAEPDAEPVARPLAEALETLALDIADTPGAGGALLATFAEQVRVLRLVAEVLDRTPDAPLPPAVATAVRAALRQATFADPLASPVVS